MPLVMARAMMSAATPAATPAMEMAVTTPTTACRRLALRYRAARKSSNRMVLGFYLLIAGHGEDGFGYADVVVTVVDADGDEVLAGLAVSASSGNVNVIVLALGVGELADGLDVLPGAGVERVFGVGDGREGVFGVEGDVNMAWARSVRAFGELLPAALRPVTTGGVVSISKRSLTLSPVSASAGVWEGASEATTLI